MNPSSAREEALFTAALERPAGERAAFLAQACGDDSALRTRLTALLAAHEQTGNVLVPPPLDVAWDPEAKPGDCIGRYLLIEKIGEGGCGTVYLAEQQEPIRRRVALKVIKLGMDSLDVVARFQAERQTLALMDHPNIANVLDAGATPTGRPFFVMELVAGERITTFCDEHQLALADRLGLFVQVCHAIQHAHQKGIIHRDIKPSNILVTKQDGAPVPKVIDFGIAKATQGNLTDRTVLTALAQFVGTPVYMSPEQAEFSGRDIDTRSDIYSLGVLLYELIVGRPPFDPAVLLEAGLDEIRRQIRDVEPPRPSTRLSTLTEADRATIAQHRNTEPGRLATLLRSDLDWIVMRCLEKDRARRYETANGLAADVERHLHHEPVTASPPSSAYRLRKLVLRHKAFFAATAVVLAALLVGTVVSTWQAVRARRAERLVSAHLQSELAARQEADEQRRIAVDQFAAATASRHEAETQRARAEKQQALAEDRLRAEAAARLESERQKTLAEQERVRAQTAEKVAEAEVQISRAVNEFLQDDLLRQADSRVQASAQVTPNPNLTVREALDRAAGRVGERFHQRPLVEAGVRDAIGQAYLGLGVFDQALEHFERVWQLRQAELGFEHENTLNAMNNVGIAYGRLPRLPEASALLEQTLALRQRLLGPENLATLNTTNNLAHVYWLQRRAPEAAALLQPALEIYQRTLGPEHPSTLIIAANLGTIYFATGRVAEATSLLEATLAVQERVLGKDHPDTLNTTNNLGSVYLDHGRPGAAARLFERVLEVRKRVLNPQHPETLQSMNDLASAYRHEGRLDDSAALLEETVEVRRQVLSPEHPDTLIALSNLGCTYWDQGRQIDATALFVETVQGEKRVLGIEHPDTLKSLSTLAGAYCAQRRYDDAVPLLHETLAVRQRLFGRKHRDTFFNRRDLGAVYLQQGNFAAAENLLLRDCYEDLRDADLAALLADAREDQELELTGLLADLYAQWGKGEDSRRWRARHEVLLYGPGRLVAAGPEVDPAATRLGLPSTKRTSMSSSRTTTSNSTFTSASQRRPSSSTPQPPSQTTTPTTPPATTRPGTTPPITQPGSFRPTPPEGSGRRNLSPGSSSGRPTPPPGATPPSRPPGPRVSPPGSPGTPGRSPPPRSSGTSSGSTSYSGTRSSGTPASGSSSTPRPSHPPSSPPSSRPQP